MPTTLEIIQSQFQARAQLAENIRATAQVGIDESRALTEAETAQLAEFTSELQERDASIMSLLEIQKREEQIADGVSGVLGAVINRDRHEVVDSRTIGERFVDSDEFRSHMQSGAAGQFTREFNVSRRALTTVDANGAVLAGTTRVDRIGQDAMSRRVFLADMLNTINVSTSAVDYIQDTTAASGYDGAEQTEGSGKSEASPTFVQVTEPVATIAKFTQLTRQVFDDYGQIPGYLDGRLRYGLARRLDNEIVAGTGIAPNLKGLGARSGIVTHAPGVVEEAAVSIRKAITAGENAEAVYEIVVLNPADAEKFDLLNLSTAGIHSTLDASLASPRTAWGLRKVVSTAVASGTALLIDPVAVALFDRQQVIARLSDSHASNFTSNILTLLLEMRVGLGLFDPKGVAKVTFKYS